MESTIHFTDGLQFLDAELELGKLVFLDVGVFIEVLTSFFFPNSELLNCFKQRIINLLTLSRL